MVIFADAIDADVLRIRHEFLDMPGLALTVPQTARLYDLSASHARAMLDRILEKNPANVAAFNLRSRVQ